MKLPEAANKSGRKTDGEEMIHYSLPAIFPLQIAHLKLFGFPTGKKTGEADCKASGSRGGIKRTDKRQVTPHTLSGSKFMWQAKS